MKKIRIHPSLCLLLVIPVMGLIYTLINREPQLVRTLYTDNNDAPYNCFPSIHCLSSYLLYLAARKSPNLKRWVVVCIGVIVWSIIISTVFVKQHVVMDVFAGIMLGHLIFSLISPMMELIGPSAAPARNKKMYMSQ